MDNKTFKQTIKKLALENDFQEFSGCYFRESSISLIGLELQKSSYSKFYYLNIQIYLQGYHGLSYTPSADLVKGDKSTFFLDQQKEHYSAFTLDNDMTDEERIEKLRECFSKRVVPLVKQMLTREGIKAAVDSGKYAIFPEKKKEIFTILGYEV